MVAVMIAAYMWSQLAWSEGQWLHGTVLHLSDEPGDLLQWLCHYDHTTNTFLIIIINIISTWNWLLVTWTNTVHAQLKLI